MRNYKYLFGPVPSRRFGQLPGVDLTPYKTCTLDYVFCQLDRTTKKTVYRRTRKRFFPCCSGGRAQRNRLKNAEALSRNGGNPESVKRIKKINEAYQILGNERKRRNVVIVYRKTRRTLRVN